MKLLHVTFLAVAALSGAAMAGWEGRVVPRTDEGDEERCFLIYEGEDHRGVAPFAAALQELADETQVSRLRMLIVHDLVQDDSFQSEVFAQLELMAPDVLRAARSSAGNIHNPRMMALRRVFAQAVLATPTVVGMSGELARHGLEISRVSIEKLALYKEDQETRFRCFLWLVVEADDYEITRTGKFDESSEQLMKRFGKLRSGMTPKQVKKMFLEPVRWGLRDMNRNFVMEICFQWQEEVFFCFSFTNSRRTVDGKYHVPDQESDDWKLECAAVIRERTKIEEGKEVLVETFEEPSVIYLYKKPNDGQDGGGEDGQRP